MTKNNQILERSLQSTNTTSGCKSINDCFNCSTYSKAACSWGQETKCSDTKTQHVGRWYNKFTECLYDSNSSITMYNYCGERSLNMSVVENTIQLKKHGGIFSPVNLYCKWDIINIEIQKTINFDFELDQYNPSQDKYTFIIEFEYAKLLYSDVTESKLFKTNDISMITFHFSTGERKLVSPFNFNFNYEAEDSKSNSIMVYIILSVASVCSFLFLGVCIYTCVRSFINRVLSPQQNPNDAVIIPPENLNNNSLKEKIFKQIDNYKSNYKENLNEYNNICTICLENFVENVEIIKLDCKHIYHYNCFYDFLIKNPQQLKCPNCNNQIFSTKERDDENLDFVRFTSNQGSGNSNQFVVVELQNHI